MSSDADTIELLHKIQSNLLDDVDDLDDQISELKGLLNETLGDLPFKFAIVIVVFLNFLYTSYDAFFAIRIGDIVANDCYCHPTDRIFHRTIFLLSTVLWTLFLVGYLVYSTCGRKHIVCTHRHKPMIADGDVVYKLVYSLLDVIKNREKKFQAQLRELVTTKFLDDDHCESIWQHYHTFLKKTGSNISINSLENSRNVLTNETTQDDIDSQQDNTVQSNTVRVDMEDDDIQPVEQNNDIQVDTEHTDSRSGQEEKGNTKHMVDYEEQQIQVIDKITTNNFGSEIESGNQSDDSRKGTHKSKRLCCIMFLKVTLIAVRFIFRFLIVPLLQLQLFSDYAWYCLLNDVIRNYCKTETNKYFIGLDHSLVIYCVYILLLISLLFSFLISWFPKGIPQVVLLIEPRRIMINTKGKLKSRLKL